MRTFSTRDLPSKAKVSGWNNTISDVFTPLELRPDNAGDFEAEISTVEIGRLRMAKVVSRPARVFHRVNHASRLTERKFLLHVQLQGLFQVCQDGKEALLEEGDLLLSDTSLPYTLEYNVPSTTLVLVVPSSDLKHHLPTPEQAIGVRIPAKEGFSAVTSGILGSLWHHANDDLDLGVGTRVAGNALDMFATTWMLMHGKAVSESAVSQSRRLQIKRHIETHLRDPELNARSVAGAFGISARYLHMLFAAENDTVCSYILRRRLEKCVKQLADPLWRKRTITEIAFSWGFNNATHFARVFRDHYHTSPRDYRNSCLAGAETARD